MLSGYMEAGYDVDIKAKDVIPDKETVRDIIIKLI